ncbi:uncharacterized protein BX663DRAFT_500604 [Cokeromyces recurvatus]|uniref:uncharacterized protein n=1 Tax=Cokeromyces recurvatus TaxID=90255 RepID=UPI00221FD905|nr:uncharacterized protein BX663DRAFT_500604 [Cokeromyces recurvatus]KAI7905698.1 hypothetical protein BX663DRAFT_500604 [Cokeromyces recurvatus]
MEDLGPSNLKTNLKGAPSQWIGFAERESTSSRVEEPATIRFSLNSEPGSPILMNDSKNTSTSCHPQPSATLQQGHHVLSQLMTAFNGTTADSIYSRKESSSSPSHMIQTSISSQTEPYHNKRDNISFSLITTPPEREEVHQQPEPETITLWNVFHDDKVEKEKEEEEEEVRKEENSIYLWDDMTIGNKPTISPPPPPSFDIIEGDHSLKDSQVLIQDQEKDVPENELIFKNHEDLILFDDEDPFYIANSDRPQPSWAIPDMDIYARFNNHHHASSSSTTSIKYSRDELLAIKESLAHKRGSFQVIGLLTARLISAYNYKDHLSSSSSSSSSPSPSSSSFSIAVALKKGGYDNRKVVKPNNNNNDDNDNEKTHLTTTTTVSSRSKIWLPIRQPFFPMNIYEKGFNIRKSTLCVSCQKRLSI